MFKDKDCGLVSSEEELKVLRRLNREVKTARSEINDVVLFGNCQQARQKRLSDYFNKYKKGQMSGNKITLICNGIKHNIYYLSIGSKSFDGFNFREIYVDASAVSTQQLGRLTEVLKILVAGKYIYKADETDVTC